MSDGDMVFIIAEAGVNYNESLDMATEMMDNALKIVNYQTFKS